MLAETYTILTNNPKVKNKYPNNAVLISKSSVEVLMAARELILNGANLLFDQNSESKHPAMNPYISVILTKRSPQLDFMSMKRIDAEIALYNKKAKLKHLAYNDAVIDDFLDLDLEQTDSEISMYLKSLNSGS